jgi:NAD(P)-dependent dehydrogenase (short-subunit alcohol dehydrogenase family)
MASPLFDLSGRTAVVVGGTSGIGRTIALGLADAGADVVATGRRQTLVDAVAGEIESRGRRSLRVSCDVTDTASLERVRDAVMQTFGRVDILVTAAGTTKRVPTLEMTDAVWDEILTTNLTGTLRACRVFGAPMVAQKSGSIITIASLSSFVGLFEVTAYVASKSAVAGLTRSLGVLLDAPRGQEFLMRTPMKRFGQLDELVGAAVFLASGASSFVTGQLLVVDGGFLASGVNQ